MCGWREQSLTLCANDVVIFMGGDWGWFILSASSLLHHSHSLIWKKIDFRADSIAYI